MIIIVKKIVYNNHNMNLSNKIRVVINHKMNVAMNHKMRVAMNQTIHPTHMIQITQTKI